MCSWHSCGLASIMDHQLYSMCRRGERERVLLGALKKAQQKHGALLGSRAVPLDVSQVRSVSLCRMLPYPR